MKSDEKRYALDQGDNTKIVKWTIIVSSAVIGLAVDYFLPGWGRAILLTLLIFGCLVGFCRQYWGTRFWVLFAVLFATHSALVVALRSRINELSLPGIFLFAVAEVILVAIILGLVFPDKKHSAEGGRP